MAGEPAPGGGGVCGVPDEMDRAALQASGEQIEQFPGQNWLCGALRIGFLLGDVLALGRGCQFFRVS